MKVRSSQKFINVVVFTARTHPCKETFPYVACSRQLPALKIKLFRCFGVLNQQLLSRSEQYPCENFSGPLSISQKLTTCMTCGFDVLPATPCTLIYYIPQLLRSRCRKSLRRQRFRPAKSWSVMAKWPHSRFLASWKLKVTNAPNDSAHPADK
jgi:hypothetical protein